MGTDRMRVVFFLLYLAIGGVVGFAAWDVTMMDPWFAGGLGASAALVLGQAHLFIARGRDPGIEARIAALEVQDKDLGEQVDVLKARTDAVETTVKHELTERRDALVTEMRQLEALIERLSRSFEGGRDTLAGQEGRPRLAPHNGHATPEAPQARAARPSEPSEGRAFEEIRAALEAGRVELHLQPVVSLPQRRVAFYEGLSRLRRSDGSLIGPGDFLDVARRTQKMGVVDTLTLFRCVQIVRRLAERDRRVGVFCNLSAATLGDSRVFDVFASFMAENRDLSGAVIFELPADRFETRDRTMRENMDRLSALGFRFSLDHAPGLNLDLPRLQDAGVRFVKMDAHRLLDQARDPRGPRPVQSQSQHVPGEEVASVFARHGVTLIADRLEDETSVVEILEYGIPFGQGHVFGSPRPIKASLMEETAPSPDMLRRIGVVH